MRARLSSAIHLGSGQRILYRHFVPRGSSLPQPLRGCWILCLSLICEIEYGDHGAFGVGDVRLLVNDSVHLSMPFDVLVHSTLSPFDLVLDPKLPPYLACN